MLGRAVTQKIGVRTDSRALLADASESARAVMGLRDHLRPDGMLRVPRLRGGALGTDLTLQRVIAVGYGFNMVESTCLRIDEVWSGLKFTHPKPGRAYANSYGTLPGQRR